MASFWGGQAALTHLHDLIKSRRDDASVADTKGAQHVRGRHGAPEGLVLSEYVASFATTSPDRRSRSVIPPTRVSQ